MNNTFIPFDQIYRRAVEVLKEQTIPEEVRPLYLIRNLYGKVRISVSDTIEGSESCRETLQRLSDRLGEVLGAHGYPSGSRVLFVSSAMLQTLEDMAQKIEDFDEVYWVDRLMTGSGWWTVGSSDTKKEAARYTLFSVKGGVGRSTTAAVLAWHLARNDEHVLVVDLDLESPGLSSAMLDSRAQPEFGVTDWFVEDLVGQGDRVIERMTATPAWAQNFDGDVRVVPAHGSDPGEYLAKLGRVYMNTHDDRWTARLNRLLMQLENNFGPTVVLLESRNGLHDIAAATVTDINADVLLFAVDSESTWTDYDILFRHWRDHGLAPDIRERLSIVSALTPELDTERYLQRFRQRAWDLFGEHLYDNTDFSTDSYDEFAFDLDDEYALHDPIPIHWTRGLATGTSLRDLEQTTVSQAYTQFLACFDQLFGSSNDADQS